MDLILSLEFNFLVCEEDWNKSIALKLFTIIEKTLLKKLGVLQSSYKCKKCIGMSETVLTLC